MTSISIGFIFLSHILACLTALGGSFVLRKISNSSHILSHENDESIVNSAKYSKTTYDIITDILRNLIPRNLIKATTHQEITHYVPTSFNSSIFERKVEYIAGLSFLLFSTF